MDLYDLDGATRAAMVMEAEADAQAGLLYLGRRLNKRGLHRWPDVLVEAFRHGNPEFLTAAIRAEGLLVDRETSHRNGRPYDKKVPSNAADTLAEGEFLRFYMRAVCVRALETGTKVRIYRAKSVTSPRAESEVKVGQVVDPAALLADLRQNVGVDTCLGLPPGPNSGLCVHLI